MVLFQPLEVFQHRLYHIFIELAFIHPRPELKQGCLDHIAIRKFGHKPGLEALQQEAYLLSSVHIIRISSVFLKNVQFPGDILTCAQYDTIHVFDLFLRGNLSRTSCKPGYWHTAPFFSLDNLWFTFPGKTLGTASRFWGVRSTLRRFSPFAFFTSARNTRSRVFFFHVVSFMRDGCAIMRSNRLLWECTFVPISWK